MKPPEKIYLQCYDEAGELLDLARDDVTWCIDQINENDAVYVVIPPPSALPLEQRLWIAQQYAMNRAQYENRVKDESLEIAMKMLGWYANDVLVGRRASEALAQIEQRLAQLDRRRRRDE